MPLTPRLDPYTRLHARFYEAVILLWILRRVNGEHRMSRLDNYSSQDVRRQFLKNLSFVCDYSKGGQTTTAVSVEEDADGGCVFWVSSNEGASQKVEGFLRKVLELLEAAATTKDRTRMKRCAVLLTKECFDFARPRIRKESRILRNAARKCIETLENSGGLADDSIIPWLRRLEDASSDEFSMCKTAYRVRHDKKIHTIEHLALRQDGPDDTCYSSSFRDVKHMISSLAAHLRVVFQLIRDSRRLDALLLRSYRVSSVPKQAHAPVPAVDAHTTLPGVLRRLLPAGDDRYEAFLNYLVHMDAQVHIEETLRQKLTGDGAVSPGVHAEIQMLHHFHDHGRRFVANDRYVACSKFACICCDAYFRHHPARVTLLDCHQKTYSNWGLPRLPGGARDAKWLDQRRVLSAVVKDLKGLVVDQISQRCVSSLNHPDSVSICRSASSLGDCYEAAATDSGTDVVEDESSGTENSRLSDDEQLTSGISSLAIDGGAKFMGDGGVPI